MTFDEIFEAYYNLYRLEAETPATTDDEYPVAMRLANEAINRWSGYDGVYWRELFTTLNLAGETTTVSTDVEYDAPDDFFEAGGFVVVRDILTNALQGRFKIIEPQDAQFRGDAGQYCFFTGNPGDGYTLHLNPVPSAPLIGNYIDYVYYKKPTIMTDGDSTTEMADPYFMVHRMLANRFRGSRNPYYGSAKSDAEDILRTMKMRNDSGNWADPWKLADNSGAAFGVEFGPDGFH